MEKSKRKSIGKFEISVGFKEVMADREFLRMMKIMRLSPHSDDILEKAPKHKAQSPNTKIRV
jgi:hypothetical protein